LSFVETVSADPQLELHGLVVLRGGQPVLEHYGEPYRADDRTLVYSCSKTLTATAVGLAAAEGRLALTDRVVDLLPDAVEDPVDDRVAELTVHHLLSMSTGHDQDTIEAIFGGRPADWARRVLAVRPQEPVGSRHVYNNGASFLLGELVRVRTGEDLLEYLTPRVLASMGIAATWDRDPLGRCLGWTGAHLTTGWLAAFGELYRCDGVWDGVRLLPEGWVAQATTRHIPTGPDPTSPDWECGYGYQLWHSREGYRLDGAFGQFALVLPERGLVVGITSAQVATQHLLDLVWDVLLPELDGPAELRASGRPAEAGLPDSGLGTHWEAASVPYDPELDIAPEDIPVVPVVTDASAERGDDGFVVQFSTEEARASVHAPAHWQRQRMTVGAVDVPVAARAGALADGSLLVELTFTESPHTLRLRFGADGRAGLGWSVPPLQGPELTWLRAH
jgi:CubicO group peptidase (beta-lactamase class C family)